VPNVKRSQKIRRLRPMSAIRRAIEATPSRCRSGVVIVCSRPADPYRFCGCCHRSRAPWEVWFVGVQDGNDWFPSVVLGKHFAGWIPETGVRTLESDKTPCHKRRRRVMGIAFHPDFEPKTVVGLRDRMHTYGGSSG